MATFERNVKKIMHCKVYRPQGATADRVIAQDFSCKKPEPGYICFSVLEVEGKKLRWTGFHAPPRLAGILRKATSSTHDHRCKEPMRRMTWAALPCSWLLLIALSPSLSAQDDGTNGVQPGDRVTLDFFTAAGVRSNEIAGQRIVDRNGEIFLPFLGTVSVAGKDAEAIRVLLEERYSVIFAAPVLQVVVHLRINITGMVRRPGSYYLDPTLTVLDALAEAGGSSGEIDLGTGGGAADASRVRLVRRSGELRILDLRANEISEETRAIKIQSGDWIDIPPQSQSKLRDDIQFYGSLLTMMVSLASLIVIIAR